MNLHLKFLKALEDILLLFFCFILNVSLTPFIKKLDSSNGLTIFIISFIFSFEIINVAAPDPNILLWIAASAADTAAVNLNGSKTLSDNGLSIFLTKKNSVFSNGPKGLPKKFP